MTTPQTAPVEHFFTRYAGHHDLEGSVTAFTPDAVIHFNGFPTMNVDAYRQVGAEFLAAFPDLCATLKEQLVTGQTVITRVEWSGTHRGPLMGIPASGQPYRASAILIDRIVDGKIVERHSVDDLFGLMQQIGAIPRV